MAERSRRGAMVRTPPERAMEEPPETRPVGALLSADPCSGVFARSIHSVNDGAQTDAERRYAHGGIQTVSGHMRSKEPTNGMLTKGDKGFNYHDPQWDKRHKGKG